MLKDYKGTCENCKRVSEHVERDHRVPLRIGGEQHWTNIQTLCIECHKRKSFLEVSLFAFYGTTETVREWYTLAFQDDQALLKQFLDKLALRLHHFEEVSRSVLK